MILLCSNIMYMIVCYIMDDRYSVHVLYLHMIFVQSEETQSVSYLVAFCLRLPSGPRGEESTGGL